MADRQQGRGRARGRGRGGRGRGRVHREEEAPRPGGRGQQPGEQRAPAAEPQPPAASGGGDQGRAVQQGAAQPGDQGAEEVAAGVRDIALQGEAGAEAGAQERRASRYDEIVFRDPSQPKTGSSGTAVTLRGNFFKMRTPRQWTVYQYHVDYMPPCDSTKLRKALLYVHKEVFGAISAFDGMMLFLPQKLPDDEMVVHSYTTRDNRLVKITIKFACEVMNINPSTIQLMNIIWRRFLGMMDMKQINRHYFNMEKVIHIHEHRLQLIPGFQTSILRYESDILLDIDITHKILRTWTVFDHLTDLQKHLGGNELCRQACKDIVGTVVLTRYNNRTYTVDDIDWEGKITDQFERHNNMISYEDYYRIQHSVQIQNKNQPLLVTRAKARDRRRGEAGNIYLVPELCIITGMTEENMSDMRLKRDLGYHTRIDPSKRVTRLTDFIGDVQKNQRVVDELKGWGLTLENNLVSIPGRRLRSEEIWMRERERGANTTLSYKPEHAEWSQDMKGKKMTYPVALTNWIIIFSAKNSGFARTLNDAIRNIGPRMGMKIEQATPRELTNERASDYVAELRRSVVEGRTEMVVCLVPNSRKDRYDGIKKFCCTERPVPSQVVLRKTMDKDQSHILSVATKITIQMNCKLGGSPWLVNIQMKGTMIIGFDTYHDKSMKGRSVGGVVATLNNDHSRYYSTTTFQTSHMELLDKLSGCVQGKREDVPVPQPIITNRENMDGVDLHDQHWAYYQWVDPVENECVEKYEMMNRTCPSRVIVFRDGVGDGQLNLVHEHEVPQVKATIRNAKLTFIVVKKKSIARFFEERRGLAGRGPRGAGSRPTLSNPGPGTIIDDVATRPTWFDFFLISQSVRQGTVTPTHFNVIMNESRLSPEQYQQLSYRLTHMYYNWQGTIRVPAPCMYAHKLAYLVGQSLHEHADPKLRDKLYYL